MYQQFNATAGGTAYRDFHAKVVQLATSYCVAPGSLSFSGNQGSLYTDGDVLTLTDGTAATLFSATFSVNVSGGKITGVKSYFQGGAFGNRVVSAVVAAGGSNYAVNDILEVQGGTAFERCKVKVASLSGSAVATVTIFNGGGSYAPSGFPSNPAATDSSIGPHPGVGTGCTLTLTTVLMFGVGTGTIFAAAVTGGSGSGGKVSTVTPLLQTGWTVLRAKHNYSLNSVTDEYETILQGSAPSGQVPPFIGMRTGTDPGGGSTRNFVAFTAMTAYNSLSTYDAQPNAINPAPLGTAGLGCQLIGFIQSGTGSTSIPCWISGSGRSLRGVVKNAGASVTAYHSFYTGLLNPFGTATESPWPMVVFASMNDRSLDPIKSGGSQWNQVSGITECFRDTTQASGPCVAWSQAGPGWVEVYNGSAAGANASSLTVNNARGVFPIFQPQNETTDTNADYIVEDGGWAPGTTLCKADGTTQSFNLRPTPSLSATDVQPIIPIEVVLATEGYVLGVMDGIAFVYAKTQAGDFSPEDAVSVGVTFNAVVFPNGARNNGYSYFILFQGI